MPLPLVRSVRLQPEPDLRLRLASLPLALLWGLRLVLLPVLLLRLPPRRLQRPLRCPARSLVVWDLA